MIDKQLILTKDGFKTVGELIPEKDYLVTKSGNFAKFIGFDDKIYNAEYLVKFMTGEDMRLSGDIVICDKTSDMTYNDVDMTFREYKLDKLLTPFINSTECIDFKTKCKVGLSHEECYNIGYRRDFKRLFNIDFTKLSVKQRKAFIAGLIDNGETVVDIVISITNIDPRFANILVFIIRSLGYNVYNEVDKLSFSPNNKIGLLPIKSQQKAQDVLYLMNCSDKVINHIDLMSDTIIVNSYQLIVDTDEPILVGYSLIPIYQKR